MTQCTNTCRYSGQTIGLLGFLLFFMTCGYAADAHSSAEEAVRQTEVIEIKLDSILEMMKPDTIVLEDSNEIH